MSLQALGSVQPSAGSDGGSSGGDGFTWALLSVFGPISSTNMGDTAGTWSWTSTDFSSNQSVTALLGPYLEQVTSGVINNATSTYPPTGGVPTKAFRFKLRAQFNPASGLENDYRYFLGILCGAGTITSYPGSPGAGRTVSVVWDDTNGGAFMISDNVGVQTRTSTGAGSLNGRACMHVVESDGVDVTWTIYDQDGDPDVPIASHTWAGAIATLSAGLTRAQTFFRPFFVNQTDIASNAFCRVGRGTMEAGYPEAT